MRKPSNPFIVSGYHSPAYFCNREMETGWLLDQFKNERNAVVYSWRRVGKTALLKHFFYQLENKKKAECLFVDLLGTTQLDDANKRVAHAMCRNLAVRNNRLAPGY